MTRCAFIPMALVCVLLCACAPRAGSELARRGDEIMIAGRLFHTGAPVVLWTDPGGYDAYRTERRFVPIGEASWEQTAKAGASPGTPNRSGLRRAGLSDEEVERVRGGGWDLSLLRRTVDQFVIHYDVCGTSRECFRVLHDVRGLSVHFMLDLDGTIYQTLDVKERAWHATTANDRAVGIEIANVGAYPPPEAGVLARWYRSVARDESARGGSGADPATDRGARRVEITIPSALGDGGVRSPGPFAPARAEPVTGMIQGRECVMYDLTERQYESLERLTAALCTVLPRIRCDYPRDAEGRLIAGKLTDESLAAFSGVLGHYHIQSEKIDPGPAFQWERVIGGARRRMGWRGAAPNTDPPPLLRNP